MVRANGRAYVVATAGFAVIGSFCAWMSEPSLMLVTVTAFLTMLLRDLRHVRDAIAMWPFTHEMLDWAKVEALAASLETPGPGRR
jgi:hypothetical protein